VYIVFKQVTIKNTSIGNNTILNKSKVSWCVKPNLKSVYSQQMSMVLFANAILVK
jgi:hypothetical protein